MINMSRARPDTMNTYMKNLPRERERRERGREITGAQKLETVACLRLSVKSLFNFDDIHRAIKHSIPIVIPLLKR
jgi:hypothetical protein